MGHFLPALLAFLLTCSGTTVFRDPPDTSENGPLASCYIFLLSMFVLIWDQRLYPKSLRRQWRIVQLTLEFIIAEFIMEQLLLDFWFPLEKSVIGSFPVIADNSENLLKQPPFELDVSFEWMRNENLGVIASYSLSIFFLIAVLHAIRAIDLRALECGVFYFFSDVTSRLIKFLKKSMPKIIVNLFVRRVDSAGKKNCVGTTKKIIVPIPKSCEGSMSYSDVDDFEDIPRDQDYYSKHKNDYAYTRYVK